MNKRRMVKVMANTNITILSHMCQAVIRTKID